MAIRTSWTPTSRTTAREAKKMREGSTEVEAAVPTAPFRCRNARAPNICSDDGPRAIIRGAFTTGYLEQHRLIGSKLHKIQMFSKSTGQKSSLIRTARVLLSGRTQRPRRQLTRGRRRNLVKMVYSGSIAAGDLGLLLFTAVRQNLLDDLPAPGEGGLDMGII